MNVIMNNDHRATMILFFHYSHVQKRIKLLFINFILDSIRENMIHLAEVVFEPKLLSGLRIEKKSNFEILLSYFQYIDC